MSKDSRQSYCVLAAFFAILQIFTNVAGQDLEVTISVDAAGAAAKVDGKFSDGFRTANERNFYFRKAVVGNSNLGDRISRLELRKGQNIIANKRFISGEYLAESSFNEWRYTVDLKPATNRAAAAHASWIGSETGILMLDDLLPQIPASAKLRLSLPEGWSFQTTETAKEGASDIPNIERSVIFVGKNLRNVNIKTKAGDLDLTIAGQWLFSDDDAAGMVREIYEEYSRSFGSLKNVDPRVAILKFPTADGPGSWEAETRGSTVTIISSDMAFKSQSLQRVHEQLRHELFHLWIPNGVDLSGDYAWFYEGFALYQSLKLAVSLNRIRFDDFLDTLSRAHTIDSNARPRRSLTDPAGDATVRYARGMLVAFLADIERLKVSKGRLDVSHLLRSIFERYSRPNPKTDGTTAVVDLSGHKNITDRYVEGSESVEWTGELAAIGIDSKQIGRATTLSVAPKLNGRQKEILDRLGYNNWRKIGSKR